MEYVLNVIGLPHANLRKVFSPLVVFGRHLHDHFIPHARNNYHPHILGDRALALFSAALVCVKIFSIALLVYGPVLPAFSSAITPDNIIVLTNDSRQSFNLKALAESSILDKAAQAKADDMLAKGYFAHTTPDGKTPWDFITGAGYNYMMAGENLAVNFTEAENVETAWMNSPGHRANILNKNFEDIGIGISQGIYQGHTAIFVVQEFGVPAEQQLHLTDAPTLLQTATVPPPVLAQTSAPVKPIASDVKGAQNSAAAVAPVVPLSVTDAQTQIQNSQINISAKILGSPVKAIAYFGAAAVMLNPQSDGQWSGQVNLADLSQGSVTVKVKAFDIRGQTAEMQLADFSNGTVNNYNIAAADNQPTQVSWMGRIFDPKSAEEKFYLFFIAGILSSMVLAIGLKRHIQHLNLITNSSFVVMLACLLWMAG
jgi:hypothetical protein